MGEYDSVLGPLILAVFINTYLSGIVGFQYLSYQYNKFTHSYGLKVLVLGLTLVDVFQMAASIYMSWLYCVTNYLDPSAMGTVSLWTFTVIPLCNAFSGVVSHLFLTHRIWKAKKNNPNVTMLGVLSFVAFALAFVSGVYGISQQVSMITPGIYNSIFSTVTLVVFLASPKTNIYLIFVLPLGRLYSMTVLTTLLVRNSPSTPNASQSAHEASKDFQFAFVDTRPTRSRHESFSLIQIKTEREIIVDNGVKEDTPKAGRFSISHRGSDLEQRGVDDNLLEKIPEIIGEAQ
ncbi:hypothetical protein CPB84DRAFT_1960320 [Gymnopilus junonius]|uniref:Uncharacterized protein n=1 Tax=Gymnopilus junonius TaxID=109634 RepID=A0A9P5TPP8_GYMJU|nr:hypothetical protein CPB84DRAFT_1960320 [Gymnopilus junonius]